MKSEVRGRVTGINVVTVSAQIVFKAGDCEIRKGMRIRGESV